MGNAAVTIKGKRVQGGRKSVVADVTLSASYATNGDTVVAADIAAINAAIGKPEVADLSSVEIMDAELGAAGHSIYLDRTAKKIKAFNGTTEIANATNLSAVVCRVEFVAPAVTGNI